jgi:hypothetical protein
MEQLAVSTTIQHNYSSSESGNPYDEWYDYHVETIYDDQNMWPPYLDVIWCQKD